MNELALFAGVGGGVLASKWMLGWRTVCYVERNPYAVDVLRARMRDGYIDDAPIWDDANTFRGLDWTGLDWWMWSLRVSRANLSAWQDCERQTPTNGTDGLPPSGSFAKYDLPSHGWKTCQVSLFIHTLEPFSESWPRQGMMRNGVCSRRKPLARTTKGNGSGYLPTPTASHGSYQRSPGGKKRWSLRGMAHHNLWPTPTMNDAKNSGFPASQAKRESLVGALMREMFGTPNTKGIDGSKHQREAAKRNGTFVTHSGGKLNPDWVEWLMGWPIGWTDLKPLGTDRFRQWLEGHGLCCEADQEQASE